MKQSQILIVDDESQMRELIELYLTKEGFRCLEAGDGLEALSIMEKHSIDLIILDIMMPNLDGFSFCREIRKHSNVPIIFVTAKGDEADKITGLKIGGDDYIVKPFSPNELVARVESVLRRAGKIEEPETTNTFGGIRINKAGRDVYIYDKPITLTLKEFELLLTLVENRGQALSREQLLQLVWGYDYEGSDRTVDTHVKTLRLKLKECGDYIKTVWGIGYKFEVDDH